MKKILSVILALVLLIMPVYAEDIKLEFDIGDSTVMLNGTQIEADTYLSEMGNTMVGLRVVAQTLGVNIEWVEYTRTVNLKDEGLTMSVVIDSDIATINGRAVKMTEAAVIRNDRTMVPIRFISEGFGATVEYSADNHSVTVYSNSREERLKLLNSSEWDMVKNYPSAIQGWLSSSDETVTMNDFVTVWDSIVNTRIMELLPGRTVTKELCDTYRKETSLTFDDIFSMRGISETDAEIKSPIMLYLNVDYEAGLGYFNIVYNPAERSITLDSDLSTPKPTWNPFNGSGGGGSTSSGSSSGSSSGGGGGSSTSAKPVVTQEPTSEHTIEPAATKPPEITAQPTSEPTVEPSATPEPNIIESTPKPTKKPSRPSGGSSAGSFPVMPQSPIVTEEPSATESPTEEPELAEPTAEPTVVPTLEPTPEITEGPEWDDDHFDDIIDGKEQTGAPETIQIDSMAEVIRSRTVIWRPVFRQIRYLKMYR